MTVPKSTEDVFYGPAVVLYHHQYGYICYDSYFDIQSAKVVCREMGYHGESKLNSYNTEGKGGLMCAAKTDLQMQDQIRKLLILKRAIHNKMA